MKKTLLKEHLQANANKWMQHYDRSKEKGAAGIEAILWVFMSLCFIVLPLIMLAVEYQDYQLEIMEAGRKGASVLETLQFNIESNQLSKKKIAFTTNDIHDLIESLTLKEGISEGSRLLSVSCDLNLDTNKMIPEVIVKWTYSKQPITEIGQWLRDESNGLTFQVKASVEYPIDGITNKGSGQ